MKVDEAKAASPVNNAVGDNQQAKANFDAAVGQLASMLIQKQISETKKAMEKRNEG